MLYSFAIHIEIELTSSNWFALFLEDFAASSANSALLMKIRASLFEPADVFLASSSFCCSSCFNVCRLYVDVSSHNSNSELPKHVIPQSELEVFGSPSPS